MVGNRRQWLLGLILVFGVTLGCNPPEKKAEGEKGSTTSGASPSKEPVQLLNVSYDPTRELWAELNDAFKAQFTKDTGRPIEIEKSHGGSASQARAIVDGMKADVATLSLWIDTDSLRRAGLIKEHWEDALPNKSLPYTSTLVFVVRKGNPKGIKDWADLIKPGISVITPNPKTSGNGRLSLLAAWGNIILNGGKEEDAIDFITKLYKNVPNLDTGARGATMTFAQKGIGDVHLTMESEAYLEVAESKNNLEIVYPSLSILHEPHVAIVDSVVDQKGTREVAEAYLKFLYTPEGQAIIAKNYYRPTDPEAVAKFADKFPQVKRFALTEIVPGWDDAQAKFFADGAIFDSIYAKKQ